MHVDKISVQAFSDQKPGTSGLRKTTRTFKQKNYLECFVQSIFSALPQNELSGCTLLVSGDGRYFNKEAIQIIAELAAANGVHRLLVGRDGLVSTPAASAIIRNRSTRGCIGGILLTASHNPGGIDGDVGIKLNIADGSPAPESLTSRIYEQTLKIEHYLKVDIGPIDLKTLGVQTFCGGEFVVEIIDPIQDWMDLMKSTFDFDFLQRFFDECPTFHIAYDAMHGVGGIYAEALFRNELHIQKLDLLRCESLEDFGGSHPDPNLTYAHDLVQRMQIETPHLINSSTPHFAAAGDGDNDRNMILGQGIFVTPSDSVGIIAAYAESCIPYFMKRKLCGVARSMPTSSALDHVASVLDIPCYETPTGWKFFNNLMNSGRLSLCGEESFGTGSDHIREKDGLWAVLCWLSILAYRNSQEKSGRKAQNLVSVRAIVEEFWAKFGRSYYTRHDYENVEVELAQKVISQLDTYVAQATDMKLLQSVLSLDCPTLAKFKGSTQYKLCKVDNFTYIDPIDKSISKNQGYRFCFQDGSRIIFRQSGTGSTGITLRVYIEKYDSAHVRMDMNEALADLISIAHEISNIHQLTGRSKPTVTT